MTLRERMLSLAKSPALAYLLPAAVAAAVNFSGSYRRSLRLLQPPGVAIFGASYELATPTRELIEDSLGDAVRAFDRRPLILIIGNSTIQGAGSLDKLFLSRLLAAKHNVINAALGGESLTASTAVALYGLKLAFAGRKPPRVDVFVAYPPARLYAYHDFDVIEGAAADLCRDYELAAYLPNCAKAKPVPRPQNTLHNLQNHFLGNARCLLTQREFFSDLRRGSFSCMRVFDDRNRSPGFLHEYEMGLTLKTNREAAADLLKDLRMTYSPKILPYTVSQVTVNLLALQKFLSEQHVPFKINLIFLQEPPALRRLLTENELSEFNAGPILLANGVQKNMPGLSAEVWGNFKSEDYFDLVHFKEIGQRKIAAEILRRSGEPAAHF